MEIKGEYYVFKKIGVFIFVLILIGARSAIGEEANQSLFVNLTSNEMDRAAMAICNQGSIPSSILFWS